jgi:hypothetical protein
LQLRKVRVALDRHDNAEGRELAQRVHRRGQVTRQRGERREFVQIARGIRPKRQSREHGVCRRAIVLSLVGGVGFNAVIPVCFLAWLGGGKGKNAERQNRNEDRTRAVHE